VSSTFVFVYGTLLDRDLLELVCEQPVDGLRSEFASMPGFEPRYVHHKVFPVLVEAPAANAYGEVIEFDQTLLQRLICYETADFALTDVVVRLTNGTDFNCYYFANVGFAHITDRPWTLDQWQRQHKGSWMTMLRNG